jgi:uncharacterized protein (TIGR02594 family)
MAAVPLQQQLSNHRDTRCPFLQGLPMTTPLNQPVWLGRAWLELGQQEASGDQINPHIRDFFADAGHPNVSSDEVAWCAAFVCACLERSHLRSTRSLRARDFLGWGTALASPCLGAIAIFSRSPDPASGHVAFVIGETADTVMVLGGNQHDAVTVAALPKSRLLALRWPDLSETTQSAIAPRFASALKHILEMEGGYTNDSADPGGPTNFGITLADYARFRDQPIDPTSREALIHGLQHIPLADVEHIYLDRYWIPSGCQTLPPPLAFFHFDTAVNMGTGTAIRMLQLALDCPVDGIYGPQTQSAAVRLNPALSLAAYAKLRRTRYRSLATFPRFGRGWLTRVDTTLARALTLSLSPPSTTTGPPAMPIDLTPALSPDAQPKWWGQSLTIWGGVVTGLAAVLPAIGPAFGLTVSPATVHTAADQLMAVAQAVAGLTGTLTVIFGRVRATQPLMQRSVTVKV